MSLKAALIDPKDLTALAVEAYWDIRHAVHEGERVLTVASPISSHSTFKSVAFNGAGTTTLVSPNAAGSLILADLVVTGDKVNGGSVEVRWTDGTDTAIILKPIVTDAPVYIHMPFVGRVQGWQDARIDVIVTNAVIGSVLATYAKVPKGLPFAEWDELR